MVAEGSQVAESKSKLEEKGVKFITDLGSGVYVAVVPITELREQDINARVMDDGKFKQLVNNIKKRGTLESLPFCAFTNKGVEIVSGHHRSKAAREAGLKAIPTLLDMSGLNRSQIAAKQLAHNAISGIDDQNTLREIAKIITDVDDMLESAIDKDIFKEQRAEIERLATPAIDVDWKAVQFTFLPHQTKDFEKLIKKTEGVEIAGIVEIEQFKPFIEALEKTQNFQDVKAVGTAVYLMVQAALEKLGEAGFGDKHMEWVHLTKIFGGGAIPKEYAEQISKAVKMMEKNGEIPEKRKWEAIAVWAAKYLDENK
jgi:hypothetical protein